MMLSHAIRLDPDDNDTFLVTCRALPEATTFGESREDAKARAVAAIEEAIAARIAEAQDIPVPAIAKGATVVTLPAMTALKVQLYRDLRVRDMSRAQLMRKLNWNRESVDRLFRIDHASKLDQIEAAFAALGERLNFRVETRRDGITRRIELARAREAEDALERRAFQWLGAGQPRRGGSASH